MTRQSNARNRNFSCNLKVGGCSKKIRGPNTYLMRNGVDINNQFSVDQRASQRVEWVLMVGKVYALDLTIRVMPVNLVERSF